MKLFLQNATEKFLVLSFCIFFLTACGTTSETNQPQEQPNTNIEQQSVPSPAPVATILQNPDNGTMDSVKNFSVNSANKVKPEDVLGEVNYPLGGGGVSCFEEKNLKVVNQVANPNGENGEWLQALPIFVCGWQSKQVVQVTTVLPNGETVIENVETQYETQSHLLQYVYYPKLGDPYGVYNFTFSGKDGSIEYKINVVLPSEPRMYYLSPNRSLFLYGLNSNETVRLFYYSGDDHLVFDSWTSYQTDNNGNLTIEINPSLLARGEFVSVGDVSGLVTRSGPAFADYYPRRPNILISSSNTQSSCVSNLPTRLQLGDYAYVESNSPLPNRVRDDVGLNSAKIGEVEPGGVVKIIDGPQCADNIVWWKVKVVNNSLVGWTAEGDDAYFLIKCNSPDSCP